MNIQFTGRNIEITPALKEHTLKKFKRIERIANNITSIQVTLNVDKLRQIAEANVTMPGTEIHARAESDDMYNAIVEMVEKVVRQTNKFKEKQQD